MNNWKIWAATLLTAFLFGALASYFVVKGHLQDKLEDLTPEVIHVIKRDTLRLNTPILREIHKVTHDTIKIVMNDTIVRRDTIYLEREQRVYEDDDYKAFVSGFQPRLDSIYVYPKTIYETKVSTRKEWRRFTYGVQAGVGLVMPFSFSLSSSLSSSPSLGVYVGVGIGYNF